MTVGVLQIDLHVPEALNLKDKRRVIKSLKDRLAAGHNISIAEVGELDKHQRCILAVAMVANEKNYVESGLSKIVDLIRLVPQVSLLDYQTDFF